MKKFYCGAFSRSLLWSWRVCHWVLLDFSHILHQTISKDLTSIYFIYLRRKHMWRHHSRGSWRNINRWSHPLRNSRRKHHIRVWNNSCPTWLHHVWRRRHKEAWGRHAERCPVRRHHIWWIMVHRVSSVESTSWVCIIICWIATFH